MPDSTRLLETEQVIDALNRVMDHEGTPHQRAEEMLRTLQEMVGHDADCELILQTVTPGQTVPQVVERVFLGPTFDRIEPRPDSVVQEAFDASVPAIEDIVRRSHQQLRVPYTYVISRDPQAASWFENMHEKFMAPHGWVDLIISSWSCSVDRLISVIVLQRKDMPAFTDEQVRITSLILRAVAPMVDREMFDGSEQNPGHIKQFLNQHELSERQTDVLGLLLRGMSEKEVARELGVSTHTVHTHVKKLYSEFNVSSRGELLALFVDQRVLRATA